MNLSFLWMLPWMNLFIVLFWCWILDLWLLFVVFFFIVQNRCCGSVTVSLIFLGLLLLSSALLVAWSILYELQWFQFVELVKSYELCLLLAWTWETCYLLLLFNKCCCFVPCVSNSFPCCDSLCLLCIHAHYILNHWLLLISQFAFPLLLTFYACIYDVHSWNLLGGCLPKFAWHWEIVVWSCNCTWILLQQLFMDLVFHFLFTIK